MNSELFKCDFLNLLTKYHSNNDYKLELEELIELVNSVMVDFIQKNVGEPNDFLNLSKTLKDNDNILSEIISKLPKDQAEDLNNNTPIKKADLNQTYDKTDSGKKINQIKKKLLERSDTYTKSHDESGDKGKRDVENLMITNKINQARKATSDITKNLDFIQNYIRDELNKPIRQTSNMQKKSTVVYPLVTRTPIPRKSLGPNSLKPKDDHFLRSKSQSPRLSLSTSSLSPMTTRSKGRLSDIGIRSSTSSTSNSNVSPIKFNRNKRYSHVQSTLAGFRSSVKKS